MAYRRARWRWVALMIATCLASVVSAQSEGSLVAETVAYAEGLMAAMPQDWPWGAVSQPVADRWRAEVIATLPPNGHVTPSAEEQEKLAQARTLLRDLHRSDVVLVVVNVPQAFVGLHGRVVLLVSRPALTLLSSAEFTAVVAHELGHDLLWEHYDQARRDDSAAKLRTLELRCDAIAVLILRSLSRAVTPLVTGLGKLERFNARIGAVADRARYPPLELRSRAIAAVEASGWGARAALRRK